MGRRRDPSIFLPGTRLRSIIGLCELQQVSQQRLQVRIYRARYFHRNVASDYLNGLFTETPY